MQPYGIQAMLKEGHKHLSGLDEAVLKNIDACKQLSATTRTSLGPNGRVSIRFAFPPFILDQHLGREIVKDMHLCSVSQIFVYRVMFDLLVDSLVGARGFSLFSVI